MTNFHRIILYHITVINKGLDKVLEYKYNYSLIWFRFSLSIPLTLFLVPSYVDVSDYPTWAQENSTDSFKDVAGR